MDNEFELMQLCSVLMEDHDTTTDSFTSSTPIAQPYHLIEFGDDDHGDHSKLLITEWTDGDEQWANQFIDGTCTIRYIILYILFCHCFATCHVINTIHSPFLFFSPFVACFLLHNYKRL